MFDAIYDTQYSLGHSKSSVTWREVNLHVYNITIQHVNAFISVCPVCIHARPQIPKSWGGRCPVHSGEFCDHMQIDSLAQCLWFKYCMLCIFSKNCWDESLTLYL